MEQDVPQVSIITPTYNRADLLERALRSVLEQTFADFEIIVVDDASEDHTRHVVRSFQDPRIQYARLQQNVGAAAARNAGLRQARGAFIAFQDSDNEWFRDKLRKQMHAFAGEPRTTGVVYGGIWRIGDNERTYVPRNRRGITRYKKEGNIHAELLAGNFIDLSAAVVRKECFLKCGGFDERLPCLQDWDLWLRIASEYDFSYLKEPLLNAYFSSDSISRDLDGLIAANRYILEKNHVWFRERRILLSRRTGYLGSLFCLRGDLTAGRKCFARSLGIFPLNIFTAYRLALSAFGSRNYRAAHAGYYRKRVHAGSRHGSRR